MTASRMLAAGALEAGYYPQSLPDFGAERSGAPIAAYTRIDSRPPTSRSPVDEPDAVVVLDDSLLGVIDPCAGLVEGGLLVINTARLPRGSLDVPPGASVWTVDGVAIALETLGRRIPNVPVLGALLRALPVVDMDTMEGSVRSELAQRFGEDIVDANARALHAGYQFARREVLEVSK